MKFNLKKWQSIQERREDLYRKLEGLRLDLDYAKQAYIRKLNHFLNSYDVGMDGPLQKAIFIDKKLTHHALLNRLTIIKTNWESVCNEFSLKPETVVRRPLIVVYGLMIDLKKLEERLTRVSTDVSNFLASWHVLEEFASHYTKADGTVHEATEQHNQQLSSSESYPLA